MHLFYFREAWRSFKHHRGLAYTSIFSLTAALTLSGVFLLIAHNTEVALKRVGDRREMVIYLRDEVTAGQRNAVLARRPQVEIMSRLGATDRFIAAPFVIEAMLEAALASLLALAVVFAFQRAFVAQVVDVAFLPWTWAGAFFGLTLALSWVAAML